MGHAFPMRVSLARSAWALGLFAYSLAAAPDTATVPGGPVDQVFSPLGHIEKGPLAVEAVNSGFGGLGVAGSFILNEDRSLPASLARGMTGYPGVALGPYSQLRTIDSVALYLENQSGDLATLRPARYDAHHVYLLPDANGGKGSIQIGADPAAAPPYSSPAFFRALPDPVTRNFVAGMTMIDTLTRPACRGRIMAWSSEAITVDSWVEIGSNELPCGNGGDPNNLPQPAGVGIAYVGSRNAIWLQNGNLYLDYINVTTRAIADELAVYNRSGHYVEHGYDPRFPGGLFPQADGPFIAGSLRFSSGVAPAGQGTGNGYQGTVAFGTAGDWEYGFWSRSARRAHFLVAPDDPAHVGATGFLDTEPNGLSIEVKPGNQQDTFQIDRASGSLIASGLLASGARTLDHAPTCDERVIGAHFYVRDGRKPGESPGNGSGVPVDCSPPRKESPPEWLSVYDHHAVTR